MTAALKGGEWSAARSGHNLPPGKSRYPFYKKLGGPQGRSGRAENLVPPRDSIPDRPARSSVATPTELRDPYNIIIILYYNTTVTVAYSIQYSNMLYRLAA